MLVGLLPNSGRAIIAVPKWRFAPVGLWATNENLTGGSTFGLLAGFFIGFDPVGSAESLLDLVQPLEVLFAAVGAGGEVFAGGLFDLLDVLSFGGAGGIIFQQGKTFITGEGGLGRIGCFEQDLPEWL